MSEETRPSSIKEDFWNLPNALTLARIAAIPLVCYLMWLDTPRASAWSAALFGAAAITDFLDGYLARLRGLITVTGKFLDPLADKLIVMAVLVVLVSMGRAPDWLVVVVLARELFINGLRTLAASEGILIAAGVAGKYKTAFQLTGLSALLIHYQYHVDFVFYEGMVRFKLLGMILFGISVFFSLWSAFTYTIGFYKRLYAEETA